MHGICVAGESRISVQGVYSQAFDIARRLRFGGVLINEAPTYRTDLMPYGGVKASGNTREGPHYAIREMTVEKLVVLNGVSL